MAAVPANTPALSSGVKIVGVSIDAVPFERKKVPEDSFSPRSVQQQTRGKTPGKKSIEGVVSYALSYNVKRAFVEP